MFNLKYIGLTVALTASTLAIASPHIALESYTIPPNGEIRIRLDALKPGHDYAIECGVRDITNPKQTAYLDYEIGVPAREHSGDVAGRFIVPPGNAFGLSPLNKDNQFIRITSLDNTDTIVLDPCVAEFIW